MFNLYNKFSPVKEREYVWLAEYERGHLAEYDLASLKANDFNDIDKDKLITFGLMGRGVNLTYNVNTGTFDVGNSKIDFKLVDEENNRVLFLTRNNTIKYNDCISFKRASQELELTSGIKSPPRIIRYSYGYKTMVPQLNFQIILHIGETLEFEIKLTSDKNLKGKLITMCNGREHSKINIALNSNRSESYNWKIK